MDIPFSDSKVTTSCGIATAMNGPQEQQWMPKGHNIMWVDNQHVSRTMLWAYPTNWLQRLAWRLLGVKFERRA